MPPKRAGFGKPIAPPPSASTNPTSGVTKVNALPTAEDERFELQLFKKFDAKCTSIPDGGVCSRYWFPPNKLDELRGVGLNGAGGGGASSPGGQSDSTSTTTATNSTSCTPQHVSPVTVVCKQFGSGQIRAAANVASRDGVKDTDAVGDDDFPNTPHPHQSGRGGSCGDGGGGMGRSTSSSTTSHHRTHPTTSGSASSSVAAISSDIHTKRLYRDTMPLCLCSAHPHIINMIGLWHDPVLLDNRRSYLLLEDLYYSVTVTPPPHVSVSLSSAGASSPSSSSSPSSPPAPTLEERTTFRSTLQHFLQDMQLCPPSSCRPRQPRNGGEGATVVNEDDDNYCDPVAEEDRLRDERCKLRRRILLAQSVSYTLIHSLAALDVCSIRHRDIKPDNVCMQRADPTDRTSPIIVKLIDFGESYLKRHGAATASTSHTLGGVGDTNGKIAAIEGMPVEERDLQAVGVLIDWILCGGGSEEFKLICEGGKERIRIEKKIRGFADDLRHEDGDIGQQSHPCNNPKFISSSLADMKLHSFLQSTTSASWLSRYRSLVALRDVLSGLNVKQTVEYVCFYGQLRDMIGEEAHVANPDWFYEYYRQSHTSYTLQKTPCDLLQHPLFDEFRPFTSNDSLVELLSHWELVGFHPEDPRKEAFNPENPDRFEPFLAKGPPKEDTMVNRVDRSRLLRSLLQYGAHLQWTSAGTQLDEWSSAMLRNPSSPSTSVSSSPLFTATNAAASSSDDLSISPPLSTSRLVEPLVKHFTAHSANILSLLLQEAQEKLH